MGSSKYILLYFPWLLAYSLASDPTISYLVAWIGSFYIFYLCFAGKIKPFTQPLSEQVLRPLFLMQIIFAGYMCCTSIFYFMDTLGYRYFARLSVNNDLEKLTYISSCQRDYVLGHAAVAHGLLFQYKEKVESKNLISKMNWPLFFIKVSAICIPLSRILRSIPGLSEFSNQATGLGFVTATLALSLAIPLKHYKLTIPAGILYGLGLADALVSGFKEPVIVSVLLLCIFLLPYYRRLITVLALPLMIALFTVLPTYVNSFRESAWSDDASANAAQDAALAKLQDGQSLDLSETNWVFLTGRLSEINMFIEFKRNRVGLDDYGLQIYKQGFQNIIPRIFWPAKPVTESLVMERVYENKIVNRASSISAKPAPVVDAYLSFGTFGVWITLFLYGFIAQSLSNKTEELFGGYFLGTTVAFTGLFQIFWRGNCFEFLFSGIFWGWVSMHILFYIFKYFGVIKQSQTIYISSYISKNT